MTPRRILAIAGVFLLAAACRLVWDLQPARQVTRASARLLKALEKRDWDKARGLISPDYKDRWGFDRATLLESGAEALRQFFFLALTPEDLHVGLRDSTAELRYRIKIQGRGTALAEMMMTRLNELDQPFVLLWRKESWQPWSWRLYSVEQAQLEIPSDAYFQ